jgi:hypothetical protein
MPLKERRFAAGREGPAMRKILQRLRRLEYLNL